MSTISEGDESLTGTESSSSLSKPAKNSSGHHGGLSFDELKYRLYQTVENKGIYDSLKSQLRRKLVFELNPNKLEMKPNAQDGGTTTTSPRQKHPYSKSNLALNTINSLIIDHLKNNEFDYTLSVFMPECGLHLNDVNKFTL